MSNLYIRGGNELNGTVVPSGSKNAALPIIFSTLIIDGVSVIENVPDISDVDVAIKLIEHFGAKVKKTKNCLHIDTRQLEYKKPPSCLVSRLRASTYLIGACLSRFGIFHLSDFGGCNFCNRPIDLHLSAAKSFGAMINGDLIFADDLCGAKIRLNKPSVGATINSIIIASSICGDSEISGAANEPHVNNLIDFLRSGGVKIDVFSSSIYIRGRKILKGNVKIIPDMIEAGTYLCYGALLGGKVFIEGFKTLELESFIKPYVVAGMTIEERGSAACLCGSATKGISVVTAPHPGYPTDLQPQAAPVMAVNSGGSIIESVWQNRFSYLESLAPFGVSFEINGGRATIEPSKIRNAKSYASDLRGGAAAVSCALLASGESEIKNAEHILRGYSGIESKLKMLGAYIEIGE